MTILWLNLRHLSRHVEGKVVDPIECVGSMARPAPHSFVEIPANQRNLIWTGLRIQSLGANIEELGHLVHFAQKLGDFQKVKRFVARMFRKGRIF